ncbi:MAG: DUF4278 domain-containing protein [Synechococcales cyanobacterium M58_A2018_015]|nr:DUF4278 domain-containing protein [Synechococcales cyanobacterium M58_A2018_015]
MKLSYRGVPYEYMPTPVTLAGYRGKGKYRGIPTSYAIFTADVPQPEYELTYRGATYTTGSPQSRASQSPPVARQEATSVPESVSEPVSEPVVGPATSAVNPPTMNERLRYLMMEHHRRIRKREQSMLARLDADIGLSVEDATHFYNHIQGYFPNDEWPDYDRSPAAMS